MQDDRLYHSGNKCVGDQYDYKVGRDVGSACWTSLATTLEVGTDSLFGIHLVFKLLVQLFLAEIPLVPFYNIGMGNHPV